MPLRLPLPSGGGFFVGRNALGTHNRKTMAEQPTLTDELKADLGDLRDALNALNAAGLREDAEQVEKFTGEVLHLVEAIALLHCDSFEKALASYRHTLRASGLRQIIIPADYHGLRVVLPESEKL